VRENSGRDDFTEVIFDDFCREFEFAKDGEEMG
jgi:hypothetical protein